MSTVDSITAGNNIDQVAYTQNTGVEKVETAEEESAFADLLQEALKELTNSQYTNAITSGSLSGDSMISMPGGFLPMPGLNNTMEQAIMKAASTGNSDDAMMALLMMMMMMQSGSSGGGEMAAMMQMMAAMIDQTSNKEQLRDNFMYSSGGAPYTLDTMDVQIFKNKIPQISGSDKAVLPLEWWRPTTPAIVSTTENRSAEMYRAVLDQFDVENAERYRPGREGYTYCNIYVWDVTRAMSAELPYYVNPETGAPMEYPDTKGANINNARSMDAWLKKYGPQYGWRQATAEEAQMHANMGKPAMTAAADVGHVQMVAPSKDGTYDPIRGVTIAQAGSKVSNYMYISQIYGAATLQNKVTYWIHE